MATGSAQVLTGFERHYGAGQALAQVLGYVAPVAAEDLKVDSNLRIDQLVGRSGLELAQEKKLQGIDGELVVEINALAHKQQVKQVKTPSAGRSITTTLDPFLSQVAFAALGEQKGIVIISDAKTGAILTLVSKPSFDPNVLTKLELTNEERVSRTATLQSWFADKNLPFFNRAIGGHYPPGSIFKLVTAAAGLQEKSFDASTIVLDEGVLKVGDYEYGNWYYRQYGRTEGEISLVRAIARSNDIYFYKAAEWIGPEKLAQMARLMGLGHSTGIELPGEIAGIVPDPAWKEQQIGERWFLGNTYHFGIGQGDLLVTPIQVAQFIQALANQGKLCQPHLLSDTQSECAELGLNADDLALILEGMIQVCSSGGTAFPFFDFNQQHLLIGAGSLENLQHGAIACKTGTAEFGGADERGYRFTHGWWVGILDLSSFFAQLKNSNSALQNQNSNEDFKYQKWLKLIKEQSYPERLVFTVMVESDETQPYKEGSADAAPVGKAIVDWMTTGVFIAPEISQN